MNPRPTHPEAVADESICGETVDHSERITWEDSETENWECTNCGAEWWQDKEEDHS